MQWTTCEFEDMFLVWGKLHVEQLQRDARAIRTFGFEHVADKAAERARRDTRKLDAIFHGTFLQGWAFDAHPNGGDLVNVAPHAARVEYGTPPGSVVSFRDIHEWCRVKLYGLPRRRPAPPLRFGGAKPLLRGRGEAAPVFRAFVRSGAERGARRVLRGQGRTGLEVEAVRAAINITAAIRERGVKPTFILRNAMLAAPRDLGRWVRKNLPYPVIRF